MTVGHYKPINSPRFVNDCHEFVFHFTPEGDTPLDRLALGVPYQDASNVTRWSNAGGGTRCRGNTWFLPYETIQSRDRERPHPATFPVAAAEFCLQAARALANRARAGSVPGARAHGASACAGLGLSCDGIEIDPQYLDDAVARVRDGRSGRPASPACVIV